MAGSERDINLVIRAKNEATKAIDSVADALRTLAKVQDGLGESTVRADGLLGELQSSLDLLSKKAQGLAALAVVAKQIDKAADAVQRLENQAKSAAAAADPLAEKYAEASKAVGDLTTKAEASRAALEGQAQAAGESKTANAALAAEIKKAEAAYRDTYAQVSKAKAPSDALKQSLKDQADALQALYTRQEQGNAAYAAQREALQASRGELALLERQLRTAASNQGELEIQSTKAADAVGRADTNLAKARQELGQLTEIGRQASASLGGVAVTQDAVAAASKQAAENLDRVKAAADRQAASGRTDTVLTPGSAAAATSAYRGQVQAVQEAKRAFDEARSAATALGGQVAAASGPTEQLATDFLLAKERAAAAEAQYRQQAKSLNDLKGVTAGFNVYLEREASLLAQVSSAQGAAGGGSVAAGLKGIEQQANTVANALAGKKARNGEVLFGLRPYELQNLSYQINDIVSGLASGQHATQILAQQGGQVFQLFQRQIFAARGAIIAMLPELAAAAAIGTVIVATMKTAADNAATFREFSGRGAASADGILYDPTKLVEATRAIQKMSTSLKDARLELRTFTQEGVNPAFLERFAQTARNVADVTGVKVPDAAKQMAAAFTSGYDAVKRLDDATNFLSATQRKQIKDLFDAGRAEDARRIAFEAYEAKQDEAAQKARGPWTTAIRDLGTAWKNFIDYLGNTPVFKAAAAGLEAIAEGARRVSEALPKAANGSVAGLQSQLKALQDERQKLYQDEIDARRLMEQRKADAAKDSRFGNPDTIEKNFDQVWLARIREIDQKITAVEGKLKTAQAGDPASADSQAKQKAAQEVLDQIQRQLSLLGDVSDADKIRLAGEHAYQDTIRATGDLKQAEAERDLARQKEIERQRQAINFSRVADKIISAEGGPNAGKNPDSTAFGGGQFIEKTWLSLFRKYFPEKAASLGTDAILALRKDQEITKQVVELYARENAKNLADAKVAVNETAIYLAHFLGAAGAKAILGAAPSTPVASLLSADAISKNPSILQGKNAGQVLAFAQGKVGASDAQRATLDTAGKLADEIQQRQIELKKAIDDLVAGLTSDAAAITKSKQDQFVEGKVEEARKRARDLRLPLSSDDEQRVRSAATGDYQANRSDAIDRKNADLKNQINDKLKGDKEELTRQQYILNEATKDDVDLTTQVGKEYEKLQGRLYDLTEQQKAYNNVVGLGGQLTSLQAQIKEAYQQGDTSSVVDLQKQIQDVVKQLHEAVPQARQFAEALGDQKMLQRLEKVDANLQKLKIELVDAKQINQDLASGGVQVFSKIVEAATRTGATWKTVWQAARDGLAQFASDFLRKIAEMILQQQLLNLLAKTPIGGQLAGAINTAALIGAGTSLTGAGGTLTAAGSVLTAAGATWTVVSGLITAAAAALQAAASTEIVANATKLIHGGGIVGSPGGMSRRVSPLAFAGHVPRFHSGGVVGLKPDEVPAILQRGERVLTEAQQRAVFGSGQGGSGHQGGGGSVKVVNVFDPSEALQHALADERGQKVLLNHVRQNQEAWSGALGRRG